VEFETYNFFAMMRTIFYLAGKISKYWSVIKTLLFELFHTFVKYLRRGNLDLPWSVLLP